MKAIVYSSLDLAGVNASSFLKEGLAVEACFIGGVKDLEKQGKDFILKDVVPAEKVLVWKAKDFLLVETSKTLLESDFVDALGAELVVFCSKHASAAGVKSFTVHFPGGFKENSFSKASATSADSALASFKKGGLDGFIVSREATHHTPFTLKTPCVFVELGSSEVEWQNKAAGRVLADACVAAVSGFKPTGEAWIGFGGGHYAPAFGERSFSHIAAKYALEFVDGDVVKNMVSATNEKVVGACVDWKGCGSFKQKVLFACEEAGVKWERI